VHNNNTLILTVGDPGKPVHVPDDVPVQYVQHHLTGLGLCRSQNGLQPVQWLCVYFYKNVYLEVARLYAPIYLYVYIRHVHTRNPHNAYIM